MANEHYKAFIAFGRALASNLAVQWDLALNSDGTVAKENAWNLTAMAKDSPPPVHWIRDFGSDVKTLQELNSRRANLELPALEKAPLTSSWQDLIKSAILEQLFSHRNTTAHVINSIARPLRVIATCTSREPWELLAEDILVTYDVAKASQPSGQLADTILGVVKNVIDTNHIANCGPIYPALELPRNNIRNKRAKFTKSTEELRKDLTERKSAEKLPEKRAFWELVRIVFTEQPKSFLDMLRFAQIKVLLLCGLRAGEVCLLPADWKRFRDYYDASGRPAGELGGYSQALMLRHFAEKQQSPNSDSIVLFETAQYIPPMFQEILTETLDQVVSATRPLRYTLRRQVEEKRILPWFHKEELISAVELYPYLTGNPVLANLSVEQLQIYSSRYRKSFDSSVFDEMRESQFHISGSVQFNQAFYMYFNRLKGRVTFRRANGTVWSDPRYDWGHVFLRVDEVEAYLESKLSTKLSDTSSLRLADGVLPAWDLMFLMPKRALAEGRNDGMCDVKRYYSVGRFDASMLQHSLSASHVSISTLFENYGLNDNDRQLKLNPHSLRHLQNSELFRLGLADSAITKQFNRKSVVQSYEYDHRSLAEELDQINLQPEIEISLGEKASTVARLIKSGRANGPIVQHFRKIQREDGEEAAFEYLKVEADGFHSTPYGHCINSFTVDPCPKHLECFAGCRHLTATNLPENLSNLLKLERRFEVALTEAQARPVNTIGRSNQIQHATIRLESIRKLLKTPTGAQVFPEGLDLSKRQEGSRTVLDD